MPRPLRGPKKAQVLFDAAPLATRWLRHLCACETHRQFADLLRGRGVSKIDHSAISRWELGLARPAFHRVAEVAYSLDLEVRHFEQLCFAVPEIEPHLGKPFGPEPRWFDQRLEAWGCVEIVSQVVEDLDDARSLAAARTYTVRLLEQGAGGLR